jgi:undecaprenyl-diphosphatase
VISFHLILLAIIQGITEFLPISSSGHLAILPHLTEHADQGLLIDAAVHVGSLGAVMLYFCKDVWRMILGAKDIIFFNIHTNDARLFKHLVLATLPLVAVGFLIFATGSISLVRNIQVIAWATLGFGVLLYMADRIGLVNRKLETMDSASVLLIGCAQILALIPGTSRSGITMTAGRLLGFDAKDSAHFSMLMSIPAILAAGTLIFIGLFQTGTAEIRTEAMIAAGLAFITAFITIALLMKWISKIGMAPFALYRVFLAVILLIFFT